VTLDDGGAKLPPSYARLRRPAMAGQANVKIPMSNKVQNPNVQKLYLFRAFEISWFRDYLFWVFAFDIHLEPLRAGS
jgi:hypothetical protein